MVGLACPKSWIVLLCKFFFFLFIVRLCFFLYKCLLLHKRRLSFWQFCSWNKTGTICRWNIWVSCGQSWGIKLYDLSGHHWLLHLVFSSDRSFFIFAFCYLERKKTPCPHLINYLYNPILLAVPCIFMEWHSMGAMASSCITSTLVFKKWKATCHILQINDWYM